MTVTKGGKATKSDKKSRGKKEEENQDKVETDKSRGSVSSEQGSAGSSGKEDSDCLDCGRAVLHTQQGIKCDGCGFWHHAICEKVAEDVFTFLSAHNDEPSLMWHCKKCVITSKKMTSMMLSLHENQQHLEERFNDLATSIYRKFDDLTEGLSKKLKNNCDNGQTDVGEKRVEEKFDTFMDTVMQKMELCDNMEVAVSKKLSEEQEEQEEIRKRKASIIIHGMSEYESEDNEVRKKMDEDEICTLLHDISCDNISVDSVIRLGRRKDDAVASPRPVKLVVATEDQKEKVLRMSKNLKRIRKWQKVFLHQDLTPKQRDRRQQLVQELRRRENEGEKNLIIVNNSKIVTRRPRQEKISEIAMTLTATTGQDQDQEQDQEKGHGDI